MVVSQQTYQIEVLQYRVALWMVTVINQILHWSLSTTIQLLNGRDFFQKTRRFQWQCHWLQMFWVIRWLVLTYLPSTYGGLRAMRLSSSMSKFPRNQISFKIKKSIQISFLFLGFPLSFEIEKNWRLYMKSKIHCQSNFSIFWRKNPLKFMFVFCYLLPFQCTQ